MALQFNQLGATKIWAISNPDLPYALGRIQQAADGAFDVYGADLAIRQGCEDVSMDGFRTFDDAVAWVKELLWDDE